MSVFGQCSEPSCTEEAVRLFDCAHHCMKLVCLQHLIEHDRLIDHHDGCFDELRTELKQLWTNYSLLIDETKLRFEFEEKLKAHQQLIQDVTNLVEYDLVNTEQYKSILEKLKQNIEQEKQINRNSSESFPQIEQVKSEPLDEISNTIELDSLDVNVTSPIEKSNDNDQRSQQKSITEDLNTINDHTIQNNKNITINNSINRRRSLCKLSGKCPFWSDGAYGLTKKFHAMYLCSHGRFYRNLYRHLLKYHQLTLLSARKVCQAVENHEDPSTKILFENNDVVIDELNRLRCPFSIYNNTSSSIKCKSIRRCRFDKPQFGYTLRCHLLRFHRMKSSNANKLICKLKTTLN